MYGYVDTFNFSSMWKNASLSVDASPVGVYKGGNTRLKEEVAAVSGSEPSMIITD
jgi:hypothetical protein